ncbi:MAG: hypothetical protein SFU83_03155 [Meiothermus sp.]|nr:hypothetical protein [Meiothermus sp.]
MFEGVALVLRFVLWLVPGVLAFLAVRAFFPQRYPQAQALPAATPEERSRRSRVGLGLAVAAILAAALVKPFPVGVAVLIIGVLAGFGGGRNPKYLRDREQMRKILEAQAEKKDGG